MADILQTNTLREPTSPDASIQALSMVFGDTVKQLVGVSEAQQVAILAATSILALMPGVAEIDAGKLAVIIQALTRGRKDADQIRERVATYAAMIVTLADKLPEAVAEAQANTGTKSKSH
jgi:hypothetical protein